MKILRFIALLIPLLLVNVSAWAQTKIWSLDECVNYAIENNIQVRQSDLQTKLSYNNLSQSKSDWYTPSLNFSSNYGINFGLNIDPVTNQISRQSRQTLSGGLFASYTIYDGGRKINTVRQNKNNFRASLLDLEKAKNDISLNVAGAYLQIILNQEILNVALEQERVSQLQVNRMQKLVDAGARPKGELLQLEAQLARDKQNTVSAQNGVDISKIQLANLLQLNDPDDFDIQVPDMRVPDAASILRPPAVVYNTALENQPDVKGAEVRIQSAEEQVDLSKAVNLPTLSLSGQVTTSYSDQALEFAVDPATGNQILVEPSFQDQLSDNVNEFVGLNLSWPIFNNAQRYTKRNARLNREIAKANLEQTKNSLRQTIYQAHADAKASYNTYLASQKAVESSAESFKYSQERFNVGALNQFDFENSKNALAVSQSEMIRAKYDYIFKAKILEFYLTNQVKL